MPNAQPVPQNNFATVLRTRSFWLLLFLFSYAFGLTLHEYSPVSARFLVWIVLIPFLLPVVRRGTFRVWPEIQYSIFLLIAWFIIGFPLLIYLRGINTWAGIFYMFSFMMIPGFFLEGLGVNARGWFRCVDVGCMGPAIPLFWATIVGIFALVLTRIRTILPTWFLTALFAMSLMIITASLRGCALAG